MNISVVIPLLNEDESLPELMSWIDKVMQANKFTYEVLFVDDGSTDNSWQVITDLQSKFDTVRGIKFRRNYGKSAALNQGFDECKGDVIITMDADLQDSPDEIPDLYKMIMEDDYDLVSGWKQKRYDPITKTLPTKLFNYATRKMSGIELNDFNCGLKAYKSKVVKTIEVYGEMHRYIPVIAKWSGFKKIGEKAVAHQARKYGTTKFGLSRFINGFLDLISIFFIGKFGKRPMHFFGAIGTLIFGIGFFSTIYIGVAKLISLQAGYARKTLVADNPFFYIALTCIVLGTMLFLAGFLGELIARNSNDRNKYHVEDRL